jgi:pimeloyl-ACP methyl ester carboxylesterase
VDARGVHAKSPLSSLFDKHIARREGFAVARDGTPIYFEVTGSTHASTVALCDGIGCDGYVWKYLEHALVGARQVVHFHYRGHGRTPSPKSSARVSIADCADDLDSVLQVAQLQQAVVFGHSMGVQVALETYRRTPDRVRGLVLICGSYGNPLRTFRDRATLERLLPVFQMAVSKLPRMVRGLWRTALPTQLAYAVATSIEVNGELLHQTDFLPYLQHLARVDVALFLEMLGHASRHTAKEILPSIRVPTLIVAGDRDGFTPRTLSEYMHAQIPGSELLVVPGGSHTAPLEKPKWVNDRIVRFLDRHGL